MADTKITALTALTGADPANDVIPIVDVSDTTMAASGTTKKISVNNILGASGTATLASATITGAATVGSDLSLNGNENYVYLFSNYSIGNNSRVRFRAVGAGGGSGYGGDFRVSTRASNNTWNTDVLTIDSSANCIWTDGAGGTRMTLNSTGFGVGGSPVSKLTVSDAAAYPIRVVATAGTTAGIEFQDPTTGATRPNIASRGAALTIETGGSDRLLIDSSGNVGVGVTPSAWNSDYRALQVSSSGSYVTSYISGATVNQWLFIGNNAFYDSVDSRWEYIRSKPSAQYIQYNNEHQWLRDTGTQTAGAACTFTQAMTLDASGNLLVGTTDTSSTSGAGFKIIGSGLGPYVVNAASTNAALAYTMYSTGAAAYRFYVGWGGTVFATNTTISAISDARLKENVQDIDVGLGAILALKPRKFDWKAGKGKDIKGDRGFIAQEFEQVFPQLVDEWKDAAPEGEAPYKSVRQDLIPVLVKAIQELTARVQTLETR